MDIQELEDLVVRSINDGIDVMDMIEGVQKDFKNYKSEQQNVPLDALVRQGAVQPAFACGLCEDCRFMEIKCMNTQMDGQLSGLFCENLWQVVEEGFGCNRFESK